MRNLIDILDFSVEEIDALCASANDIIEYLEEDAANRENVDRIRKYLEVYGAKA